MKQTEEDQEIENELMRRTLSSNIKASLGTNIFYLLTRLFIPPYVLGFVPLAEYGLWSYCFIILSYLGMGVFGVTNVYVRYITVYAAEKKLEPINQLLSTGIFSISFICILLFTALSWSLPWLLDLFHVEDALRPMARTLILGTTLIFMVDLTIGAFIYVLHSLQEIVLEKFIWMLSFVVESLFIVILLHYGYGIYSLLWAFAVRTVISIVLSAIAAKKKLPSLWVAPQLFRKAMLKLFVHFGGIVQLSGLLGIINRSIEKVFAGSFLGLEATALYEVGEKFPVMSLNLPGSVTAVFLPATTHFHAKEQDKNILTVYTQGSRFINLLTGSMMGFMAAFSTPLIQSWLGMNPTYLVAASILSWFTIAYQLDTLTGPPSAIYRAINQPQKELYYGFLQLVTVVIAAAIGFTLYGATIAMINITVVSMMVLSALSYLYFSNKFLGVSQKEYLCTVLLPGLLPYAIGFALWWLTQSFYEHATRGEIFTLFLGCLSLYLAIWTPLLYWGLLSGAERKNLTTYFLR